MNIRDVVQLYYIFSTKQLLQSTVQANSQVLKSRPLQGPPGSKSSKNYAELNLGWGLVLPCVVPAWCERGTILLLLYLVVSSSRLHVDSKEPTYQAADLSQGCHVRQPQRVAVQSRRGRLGVCQRQSFRSPDLHQPPASPEPPPPNRSRWRREAEIYGLAALPGPLSTQPPCPLRPPTTPPPRLPDRSWLRHAMASASRRTQTGHVCAHGSGPPRPTFMGDCVTCSTLTSLTMWTFRKGHSVKKLPPKTKAASMTASALAATGFLTASSCSTVCSVPFRQAASSTDCEYSAPPGPRVQPCSGSAPAASSAATDSCLPGQTQ